MLKNKLKRIWWGVKSFFTRWYYGNPANGMKIIGVTGTNGKTTVTTLLYHVANALGEKSGRIGTGDILMAGEKLKLSRKIPTTPDSVTLTKIFAKMRKAGCKYVFMEVSSHAITQNRLAGIEFTGGIFTNLTQDHLDYHKTMENYFLAKRKFFEDLPEGSWALSNDDDERGEAIVANTRAKVHFYSLKRNEPTCNTFSDEDFCGEITKKDFEGIEISIGEDVIISRMLGRFNAYNIIATWGALSLLGFDKDKVKKALVEALPPAGRFEHFVSGDGVMIVVDYAHTPDALQNVLETARDIKAENSKLISVFGCGGDKDRGKRPMMGKIGAELSDITIFTSDNPRNEEPEDILKEIKGGVEESLMSKVIIAADRSLAIARAVKLAEKGDIILIAGKGHETYQEIKGKKYPFSDIEEVKKYI